MIRLSFYNFDRYERLKSLLHVKWDVSATLRPSRTLSTKNDSVDAPDITNGYSRRQARAVLRYI